MLGWTATTRPGNKRKRTTKRLKHTGNPDLKPFRSEVKGEHSIDKEFQSLAVQGRKVLT